MNRRGRLVEEMNSLQPSASSWRHNRESAMTGRRHNHEHLPAGLARKASHEKYSRENGSTVVGGGY
jgi:hypothetical protein